MNVAEEIKKAKSGIICIRVGNENQEPAVVYTEFKNGLGLWVCNALNTGQLLMANDEALVPYDFMVFEKMRLQWRIGQLPTIKERLEKDLEELTQDK